MRSPLFSGLCALLLISCSSDDDVVDAATASAGGAGGAGGASAAGAAGGPAGASAGAGAGQGGSAGAATFDDEADPPFVPPAERCDAPSLDAPTTFAPCNTGSGIFGAWVVDDRGLPAYDYGLDQRADMRASFFNTEKLDRRDHWHALGNHRINALFYNDGHVEVATQDRGVSYLNKLDEEQQNHAGGFSYIDDGVEVWATAHRYRPEKSRTRRRFGMGYAEAETRYRGISVTHRYAAPPGDAPVLVDEVTIENLSPEPRSIRHHELWDVALRNIRINWVASGIPLKNVPGAAREGRDALDEAFDESVHFDEAARAIVLRRTHAAGATPPPPSQPDPVDHYPGDPFVAALLGDVHDAYVDQAAFFGDGGPRRPTQVAKRQPGAGLGPGQIAAPASGKGQGRMLTLRSDLSLAPGEKKTLRFAFGYTAMGAPVAVDPGWAEPAADQPAAQADELRSHLLYFATEASPQLHRELAWHQSQIEVSVGRRDYFEGPVVPQGSAYLYLHGADGAARDLGLFALPLAYTHPSLARAELRLFMGVQFADGRFSYAFQGHGMLDDAGLHSAPSDLPLFFAWALSEYIAVTGDVALLDEPAPYYPRDARPGATGFDHLRDALRHLFDVVGTGPHGLLRVGTGDWSDGIVAAEAKDRELAITKGESVPNTQMAIAVLPLVAAQIEPRDPALAAEVRQQVEALKKALHASAWAGDFYGRVYFGDGVLRYADKVNLEAQVWSLIGGSFETQAHRDKTLARIAADLDDPSPAGAMLLPGGQVWPAISALLTWGYAKYDRDRAFAHLARNTMAAHATAFPAIWYGIWSGPDGLNGPVGERPGETWYSQVTPMTDFPTMNNNQHAMPLLAALRVAGLEPIADGLRVDPKVPGDRFSLRSALVDLDVRGGSLRVVYRPAPGVARQVEVVARDGEVLKQVMVDGAAAALEAGATTARVSALAAGDAGVVIEVTSGP